jgi:hypothetical protein
MVAVRRWTGVETEALRHAMRLSIRVFAARLGVNDRTVIKWKARGSSLTLRPATQQILDCALGMVDEEVRGRFGRMCDRGVTGERRTTRTVVTRPRLSV